MRRKRNVCSQLLGLALMACFAASLFSGCFPHVDVTDVIELPPEGGKTTFRRELDFYELVDKEGMKRTHNIGNDSAYVEYKWLRIEYRWGDDHITFVTPPNDTGKKRHMEIQGMSGDASAAGIIVRQKPIRN